MLQANSADDYIQSYWQELVRENRNDNGTLIGLPYPYLVPSNGSMFQEFYYWDSYFIAIGLLDTAYEPMVIDMTENMAYLINRFGFIPNASRYYFTSRSQPPFFTRMVWLSFEVKQKRGDADCLPFLARMMDLAAREYQITWMGDKIPHERLVYRGLSRYFDVNYLDILAACESGWDHSTRCQDNWLDHLPVDLNSILFVVESDLARAAALLDHPAEAESWTQKAQKRAASVRDLMWDADQSLFNDFNWRTQKSLFHPTLAAFYPLWAGLATPIQARSLVKKWLPQFLFPGGLVTSLDSRKGRQWAYPNGWAPLQWIVASGLDKYGYQPEAQEVRQRWNRTCETLFARNGTFWEKYNVVDVDAEVETGLYGQVPGFGWSNGVYVDFKRCLNKLP